MEAVIDLPDVVDANVGPRGSLEMLSQSEIEVLMTSGSGSTHDLFRKCALAVLNSGSDSDNAKDLFERYRDFDVQVVRRPWAVRLSIRNAPASAFVDGQMITGVKEHLFAVLRDIVYIAHEVQHGRRFDLSQPADITNAVFHIVRNARLLDRRVKPNLVVCWGGHSISDVEYQYTKKVGYELGLRGLDVCTGCGPGAMKGPMKGATIGHAKQRIGSGRYIGVTEPGIIAAEPPNAIVNQLVILPDIEKRLEAFVRLAHGIVVFPGGAGTAEELLYLLGILLDPRNAEIRLPVVLTGPAASAGYFTQFQRFIAETLGPEASDRLTVIVGDPRAVAQHMVAAITEVRMQRRHLNDAYGFNWLLQIPDQFQQPFLPTHQSMRALALHRDQPVHELTSNLRRAFSGIVAGNVKEHGIAAIERDGPYELHGDPGVMRPLDELLQFFVAGGRMKLPGSVYKPCYRIVP